MNQEKKKVLAPGIKKALEKYGIKGSLSVRNYSTLVCTLKSGGIDFAPFFAKERSYDQVNVYWIERHYEGIAKDFLFELRKAMMTGNHDNSDITTDYFDVGRYVDINVGEYNKPYLYIPNKE